MQLENSDMATPCSTTERLFREPISGKQVASEFSELMTEASSSVQWQKKKKKSLPCHTKIYREVKSNDFKRTGFWLIYLPPSTGVGVGGRGAWLTSQREGRHRGDFHTDLPSVSLCFHSHNTHLFKKVIFLLLSVVTTSYKWLNREILNRKIKFLIWPSPENYKEKEQWGRVERVQLNLWALTLAHSVITNPSLISPWDISWHPLREHEAQSSHLKAPFVAHQLLFTSIVKQIKTMLPSSEFI